SPRYRSARTMLEAATTPTIAMSRARRGPIDRCHIRTSRARSDAARQAWCGPGGRWSSAPARHGRDPRPAGTSERIDPTFPPRATGESGGRAGSGGARVGVVNERASRAEALPVRPVRREAPWVAAGPPGSVRVGRDDLLAGLRAEVPHHILGRARLDKAD